MAFDPDAYLAAKEPAPSSFDPDAYLAAKETPRPTVDVHALARAESGQSAGPRELSAEQAGTLAGPISQVSPIHYKLQRGPVSNVQAPAPADLPESDYVTGRDLPGGGRSIRVATGNPNEMADPLARAGVATALGMAGGEGAATLVGAAPRVGAALAPAARMATEGAISNKAYGGDLDTGAALGLIPFVAPKLARGVGRTVENQSGRSMIKDVTKGTTKAPARLANEVKFRAGDEGSKLVDVLSESPEARRAVVVKARTDPRGAAADLTKVIDTAENANSADFAAMQRQHGGVPWAPVIQRLESLADRLNAMGGHSAEEDGVRRVIADWNKRYVKGDSNAMIPANKLRNIRNEIGDALDSEQPRPMKAAQKRRASARIYGILSREVEDLGEMTRGVDIEALKKNNRIISQLLPVRDALLKRADSEADMGIIARAKKAPGNAVRRGYRELREGIGSLKDVPDIEGPGAGVTVERERKR